jgi:hypothetical protein
MKSQQFSDEIIEIALPQIHKSYSGITVAEIRDATLDRLPLEVRLALETAQSKFNKQNEIFPIYQTTKSLDGVTCANCNEDLIVKEISTRTSTGVYQKKVLMCPFKGLDCKAGAEAKVFDEMVITHKNTTIDSASTFVWNTREKNLKCTHKWFKTNIENGFIVSTPNKQMTEVVFGLTTTYNPIKKVVKKDGKIIEYMVCEHGLEEYLQIIDKSELYNIVKVERVGNMGINYSNVLGNGGSCPDCSKLINTIHNELMNLNTDASYDSYRYIDYSNAKEFDIYHKHCKDVVKYQITVQRNDKEIPKIILELLNDYRFNQKKHGYLASYEVTDALIKKVSGLSVPDSLKAKVTAQLKSLSKKNLIEIEVIEHIFADYRYGKSITHKAEKENEVDRHFKNTDYVGDEARTLNQYRANDNSAIYITKGIMSEIERLTELRKRPNTMINDEQWNFDHAMFLEEIWYVLQTGLGMTTENKKDFSFLYETHEPNQITIACLSGIKRQRKSRR